MRMDGRGYFDRCSTNKPTIEVEGGAKNDSMHRKMELGRVFTKYFGIPCQFSSHKLLHIHSYHTGLVQQAD
jgi:hypothetical protein